MIDVSIIFVNYKTSKLVKDVLESIKNKTGGLNYEIIIVDNSCDDNEFNNLQQYNDDAIIIDSKANLGFGKANNLGSKYANGKYLFFLNTDTLLINNAIYELFRYLEDNKNCGIVGSNLYTIENNPTHSFIKPTYDLKFFKKDQSILKIIKRRFFKREDFNYTNKPLKISGYVCGASLMISKENFNKLRGFDKDIFMYAEESLLCYRLIHELGLEIYNIPSSKIIHFEGASFGKNKKCMSEFHANSLINGSFIYFSKAFSKEIAIKYIKYAIKVYTRKIKLSKITKIKDPQGYINLVNACKNKLNEEIKPKEA